MGIGNSNSEACPKAKTPTSILVPVLCGIKVYIVNVRNRTLISIGSKSWTRMECGIIVPKLIFARIFLISASR